jgi:Fur family ferric uptake transcriptional regulator
VAELPTIATILKRNGYSYTKTRRTIFNALSDSGPLTMSQLTNKVRAHVDRTSVYRTVDLFEKLDIINRLQIGWKYKLELSDLFTDHHHHATCLQCGTVFSLDEDESLEFGIRKLAQNEGFTPASHTLEIRGICFECKKKAIASEKNILVK